MTTDIKNLTKTTNALIDNSKQLIKGQNFKHSKGVLEDLISYQNYLRTHWVAEKDKTTKSKILKLRDDLTTAIRKFKKFLDSE